MVMIFPPIKSEGVLAPKSRTQAAVKKKKIQIEAEICENHLFYFFWDK